mmetsp:Transcript_16661/g.45778  ORF Transcript_16661/g.45778 Transcript_16661/m.45778 type:complete len:203 (-) Transcript_16661:1926-2534(-)
MCVKEVVSSCCCRLILLENLIHLYCPINSSYKPERCQETHSTAVDTKANTDHTHVSEVHDDGQETNHFQTASKEPNSIGKEVDTSTSTVPERPPPPAMVFSAELKISEDDTDLRTCGSEDHQDSKEESHDVVNLVQPESRHDESKFNANTSKRQETSHDKSELGFGIARKGWDHTSNLVCLHRAVNLLGLKSKVGANKDQRR